MLSVLPPLEGNPGQVGEGEKGDEFPAHGLDGRHLQAFTSDMRWDKACSQKNKSVEGDL